MEHKAELIQPTAVLIKKDFKFDDGDEFPLELGLEYKQLKAALAARIDYMLERDFEFLMHCLYRIDVNEAAVKRVLNGGSDQPDQDLAELIIQREMQKVETRQKYSQR